MEDPEDVEYNVRLTFYTQEGAAISGEALETAVREKVEQYTAWQCAKLGRDINPSVQLHHPRRWRRRYHVGNLGADLLCKVDVSAPRSGAAIAPRPRPAPCALPFPSRRRSPC